MSINQSDFQIKLERLIKDHVEINGLNIVEEAALLSDTRYILMDKVDELRPTIFSMSTSERVQLIKQYLLNNHGLLGFDFQLGVGRRNSDFEYSTYIIVRVPESYFDSEEWLNNPMPSELYDIDIVIEPLYDNENIPL